MRIDLDRTNLTIVGNWNASIFGQQWVGSNVFNGRENVQMEIGTSPVGLLPRFTGDHFRFTVLPDRVIWQPQIAQEFNYQQIEESAVRLLHELSVTPVQAVGVNLGFYVPDPENELHDKLMGSDNDEISALGLTMNSALQRRTYQYEKWLLNITFGCASDSTVQLDVNYHRAVADAAAAQSAIEGYLATEYERAIDLLAKGYGFSIMETT